MGRSIKLSCHYIKYEAAVQTTVVSTNTGDRWKQLVSLCLKMALKSTCQYLYKCLTNRGVMKKKCKKIIRTDYTVPAQHQNRREMKLATSSRIFWRIYQGKRQIILQEMVDGAKQRQKRVDIGMYSSGVQKYNSKYVLISLLVYTLTIC